MTNEEALYMKGYNEGYFKAENDYKTCLGKIIRSKEYYPYISGDDYGNLVHQICEAFEIEEPYCEME